MSVDGILECVRKTNPGMTRDKLIEELSKCKYSSATLLWCVRMIRSLLVESRLFIVL